MTEQAIDKRRIADSFGRAAETYDQAAAFQRTVGGNLLARLPVDFHPADTTDLGCGTGYFTRALQQRYGQPVLGIDLAEGMLRFARMASPGCGPWIAADAEALPVRAGSQDLIFSSLALQWCSDLRSALSEAYKALRPGGYLAFNTLIEGSLGELRQAWERVDGFVHVNRFMPEAELRELLSGTGFAQVGCEIEQHVLHYQQLGELTRELKALGAHNVNPGRPGGLTGRARLRALTEAYEQFRYDKGLPATYQVAQIVLRKGAA
ncbi:malonyl-ACP O-methyltransferase BioC [Pseudomonas sp. gcc21]|uniref:malonyl-ACP O-methyltransferase BioC n=1 Tax=Pseudomonas sp. gcc21 TaxID=2726989 RepID=UPI0014516C24|nr:malonyl-ACP O-methyltransferase BioC [Pseudomonas sp. gcc21]QJD60447.1 malonyl-ACP O-methyltransferase BioC [Pseudomonas sp. gcc21]